MANNDKATNMDRRKLIQNTGKGLMAGGIITSGSATAKSSNDQPTIQRAKNLSDKYSDPELARSAVQEHAKGTLRGIQRVDSIPDDAQIELTNIKPLSIEDYINASEGP